MTRALGARTWMLIALVAASAACGNDDAKAPAGAGADASADGQGDASDGADDEGDATGADSAGPGDDTANPDDAADASDGLGPDAGGATDGGPLPCPGSPGCPCDEAIPCAGDDDACTKDPVCDEGYCTGFEDLVCDDGNACTADACDIAVGCTTTDLTTPCEDGDYCTYADKCSGGSCVAGAALGCEDGDICTDDACDPVVGCSHSHNNATCVDANACIEASVCDVGSCAGGKIVPCGDGNACTVDRCSPETGCVTKPWPIITSCPAGASHDDTCYFALDHAEAVTWTTARAACDAQGGMLAAFSNRPAEEVARSVALGVCGKTTAWIGLDDRIRNNVWRWSDGSTLGWQNWNKGEPNNSGGEDVVQLHPDAGWNDVPASSKADCTICMARIAPSCSGGACLPAGACADGACKLPAAATQDCDDSDPCTSDSCGKTACTHVALADGVSCTSDGGVCQAGACQMPIPSGALPQSCAAILAANPAAPTGVYALDDGAGGSWKAHCDMDTAGGGWTLVLRVDGQDATFAYSGKGWSETTALGADAPGLTGPSARLHGYAHLPVSAVLLAMDDEGTTRRLELPVGGASLHAMVTSKTPIATQIGAPKWRALVTKPALQPSCHVEGAHPHVGGGGQQIRLGILGNNENDCGSPDSWIGLGGDPGACGKAGIVAGNVACYGANAKNAVLARVYVR